MKKSHKKNTSDTTMICSVYCLTIDNSNLTLKFVWSSIKCASIFFLSFQCWTNYDQWITEWMESGWMKCTKMIQWWYKKYTSGQLRLTLNHTCHTHVISCTCAHTYTPTMHWSHNEPTVSAVHYCGICTSWWYRYTYALCWCQNSNNNNNNNNKSCVVRAGGSESHPRPPRTLIASRISP